MKKYGIDISKHQGDINLSALKGNVDFVIIRAGYSNTIDGKFERNYNLCKQLGIPVGVYWYSYALSVEGAKKEAESFKKAIAGKQFEYPVYLDMEDADGYKKKNGYNFNNSKAISEAFCSIIEKAGYYTGIYASKSWFDTYLKGLDKYNKWIAHWAKVSYEDKVGIGMHQYTDKLKLNGYGGNLDGNYAHIDFPTIIKNAGLNGYSKGNKKPVVTPTKKSNEEIANEVLNGLWGNGEDRKNRLKNAGYDYNSIQSIVNNKVGAKKTPVSAAVYHTVAKGETLSKIANKYGTNVNKIASLNPSIKNVNKIYVGQKIRVK